MAGTDISKASLPITVVAAVLIALLGYWVNAQDTKIEKNSDDIEAVEDEVDEQKLEVKDDIAEIKTQQALAGQLLQQIAKDIEKIAEDKQ
jgi:uncharacterized protein Yka (UPF0111/DUF47 family)